MKAKWMTADSGQLGRTSNLLRGLIAEMGFAGKIEVTCPDVESLHLRIKELEDEVERHATLDYWAVRGKEAEAERDALRIELAELREKNTSENSN